MSIATPTLGDLFTLTARDRWKGTKGEGTAIRNALDVIGIMGGHDIPLSKVSTTSVDVLVGTLGDRGLTPATINRKLSALSLMFSVGVKRGILKESPHIQFYAEGRKDINVIDSNTEWLMSEYCVKQFMPTFISFIRFMIDTGFRLSEAINIESRGYNAQNQTITVWNTKNGVPRTIPLTQRALHAFLEFREVHSERPFSCFTVDSIQKAWARMRKELGRDGDPSFTPHVMRHTCASRLVNGGADILIVKEWLGHKSLATTMRYMHLNPKRLLAAVSILEAA